MNRPHELTEGQAQLYLLRERMALHGYVWEEARGLFVDSVPTPVHISHETVKAFDGEQLLDRIREGFHISLEHPDNKAGTFEIVEYLHLQGFYEDIHTTALAMRISEALKPLGVPKKSAMYRGGVRMSGWLGVWAKGEGADNE